MNGLFSLLCIPPSSVVRSTLEAVSVGPSLKPSYTAKNEWSWVRHPAGLKKFDERGRFCGLSVYTANFCVSCSKDGDTVSDDGEWSCGEGGIIWEAERISRAVGGEIVKLGDPGSICTDSRKIREGEWFLALVGPNFDGHDFIPQALDRGCAGVIGQYVGSDWTRGFVRVTSSVEALHLLAAYVRRLYRGPVVGITGSTGKTTARAMTSLALTSLGHIHQTEGNFNNHIGVPLTLLKLPFRASACVLEMGMSAAGEIQVLAGIAEPSVRVLLNVGPAHMENFEKLEDVAAAKGELFSSARPGNTCILNADDPLVMSMILPPAVQVIFFGSQEGCHIKLVEAHATNGGRSVRVVFEQSIHGSIGLEKSSSGFQIMENFRNYKSLSRVALVRDLYSRVEFEILSPGLHLSLNACAAAAVATALGIPLEKIRNSLIDYFPVGMRSRFELIGDIQLINDAHNSNPMSLESGLRSLSSMDSKGRKVALLGDMLELGNVSKKAHLDALALCKDLHLNYVGLVGQCFSEAAVSMGFMTHKFVKFDDSNDLASLIDKILRPGDVVLVKGSRGMRMEVVVDSIKRLRNN